jgi:hypothetical protein
MADERITVDHPLVHAPGVYFGLGEEEYHAALALSATGIKALRIDPMEWWAHSPLNPERQEVESEAMKIGKAFHARIVEGSAVFERRYAPVLEAEAYPDALRTVADLTAGLARYGRNPPSRALKAEISQLLLRVDPDAQIWDEMVRRHSEIHEGKVMLDGALIRKIERAAQMIERHPSLARAFLDGAPEVSVFWVDDETGVPCKARFDYLKPRAIVDLKSFALRDAVPEKAVARAVANYKYHIQASFYLRAAEQLPELVAAGQVVGAPPYPDFLREVTENQKTFLFVWQATGTPIVLGKVLGPGIVLDMGHSAVEYALMRWAEAWRQWGTDEWVEIHGITAFDDGEFPPWIAD